MNFPRLTISDGTLEFLKWLALLLMTGDHVNKYLFNGTVPWFFSAGRLALPLFAFVLGYKLARPGMLPSGGYGRTMKRLAGFGVAATPVFIALGGLVGGWWPLNVMFTLLAATVILYLVELGGKRNLATAVVVFLAGGSFVEFWWPGLVITLAGWCEKRAPVLASPLLIAGCFALWLINGNPWVLAVLPLIGVAALVDIRMPRWQWAFYVYYPLHLAAIWLVMIPMRYAGYLFFT